MSLGDLSQTKLQALYENLPIGFGFADNDAVIYNVNEEFCRIFRYSKGDLCGTKTYLDLADPRYHPEIIQKINRLKNGPEKTVEFTVMGRRGDGTIFPLLVTAMNICDEIGETVGVAGMVKDLTDELEGKITTDNISRILKMVYETSEEAIFLIDPLERTILHCNRAATDMFGYSYEEMAGKTTEFLHVDQNHYERFGEFYRNALKKSENFQTEYILRKKDGQTFPSFHKIRPIYDRNGSVSSIYCVVKNTEKEKNLSIKSETTAKRLKHILDHSEVCLFNLHHEPPYEVIYLSENISYITGYEQEKIYSHGFWHENLHPDDADNVLKQFKEFVTQGNFGNTLYREYRWKCSDGQYCWFSDHLKFYREDTSEQLEIIGLWQKIDAKKRAEIEIRQKNEEYRRLNAEFNVLLNAIPEELVFVAPDLTIKWANEAMLKRLGRDILPTDLTLHDLGFGIFLDDNTRCVAQLAAEQKKTVNNVVELDEGRVLGVKASPVFNSKGEVEGVLRLTSDITERVRKQQEEERSSRLESLGVLSAGIAHEINNPNGIILNNSKILVDLMENILPILDDFYKEEGDLSLGKMPFSRIRGRLKNLPVEIYDAAERINDIVGDLKGFMHSDDDHSLQLCSVEDIVHLAVRLAGTSINSATHNFHVDLQPNLPPLQINKSKIEQVLVNLLINASQALTNNSQAIHLDCRHDPSVNTLIISVKDEGKGIPKKDLPHIFEPFFTSRRAEGGSGLGLSICKRIVEMSGGRMDVHSVVEEGTTVEIHLPAVAEPS